VPVSSHRRSRHSWLRWVLLAAGFVTTQNHGVLEFLLVLSRT
jgi:hypothetical protein